MAIQYTFKQVMNVDAFREKIIIETCPHLKILNGQKIANKDFNVARDVVSELESRPKTTATKMRAIHYNQPQIEQIEERSELEELKSKNKQLKEEKAKLKVELENCKKGTKPKPIAHYSDSDDEKFSDHELNDMYQQNKKEMCELRKSIRGLSLQGNESQLRVKQMPKLKQNEFDYAEEL
jgi:hypothetical protein